MAYVTNNSQNSSGSTNIGTTVGIDLISVSRSGTSVSIKYRAWIKNTDGNQYWSQNSMCLWLNGTKYFAFNSNSGSNKWYYGTTSYAPSSTGDVTTTVTIPTTQSTASVTVGVNGNYYDPGSAANNYTFNIAGIPVINKPTLSNISTSNLTETSVKASFTITDNGGESVSDSYIDIFTDSGLSNKVGTINSASGTFTGLNPGRQYWIRGNAANSAGRSYTNTPSVTTVWNDPTAPSNLSIASEYGNDKLYYCRYTLSWNAGSAGSTPIAGYRVRIYKNGTEVACIDTETSATSYNFYASQYNFQPGDTMYFGLYSYSKDYAGNKHFNGGGAGSAHVVSSSITVTSDKFIWVSENGGTFKRCRALISLNGGSFTEIKRTKVKII